MPDRPGRVAGARAVPGPRGDVPVARLTGPRPTRGPAVELRPAGADDEGFLRELDRLVVAEQLGLGAWAEEARRPVLELQWAARRRDRATRFPAAAEQVIWSRTAGSAR